MTKLTCPHCGNDGSEIDMRDQFKMHLYLENDDLGMEPNDGVARILRQVADAIERGTTGAPLYDINGDRVGRFDMHIDED